VAALGDSVTVGVCAQEHQDYPSLLQVCNQWWINQPCLLFCAWNASILDV
jgi:hypothetical protein